MKKKNFTRYYPLILLLFVIEFTVIWGTRSNVEANSAPLYADECPTIPDDGKGLSSCQVTLDGHQSHDHAHTLDYEPTHALFAQALQPCVDGLAAGTYPCDNVDLLSFLPLANMGGGQGSDIWGWTDPVTGNEYALMGKTNGTAFVDITDPVNPVYLGNLPTHTANSTWRDIKVYQNHAFIVSEASSHGMQVFDLTQLRTVSSPPVTFSNTAHYNGIGSAHNIVINEDSGFAYAVGADCSGGLHMINIQTPTSPTFAGCYSGDGYTHDAQCVIYNGPDGRYQGHEICFNANEDTLTIVDVSNKSAPVQLSRTPYIGVEYAHQGWLTEDHVHFLFNDELDEYSNGHNTRTYVWDVSDLENPSHTDTFTSALPNIDHNLYVKGDFVYEANYRAGLRILDMSNMASGGLTEVAYFDVYPTSNSASFNGAWSNYPFFDSGVVIVSGIEQGLFVLQPNLDTAPAAVTIDGAIFTASNENVNFEATITPLNATQPVSYTWSTSDHAPVTHQNTLSDTITFNWPLTGTKTITVTAENTAGVVTDTHTIIVSDLVNGQDLVVVGAPQLVTPLPLHIDTPVEFAITVKNMGYFDVNAEFAVNLFVNPTTINPDGIPLAQSSGSVAVANLAGGESKTVNLTLPAGLPLPDGTHKIYAMVDTFNAIGEVHETNNISTPLTLNDSDLTQQKYIYLPMIIKN